jgi:hypothetical protein
VTTTDSEPVNFRDGRSLGVADGAESATGVSVPSVVNIGNHMAEGHQGVLVCSTLVLVGFVYHQL